MKRGEERTMHGRALGWLAAVGVAVLVALAVVPTLSGVASATPATASGPVSWAYCGTGSSTNTVTIGSGTGTWDAMFGWCVIFTATNTTPGTVMLEEQRTVGITISSTWTGTSKQLTYNYHAQEVDAAFANITNRSTVYSNGSPLPALGIDNASAAIRSAITQSISETMGGTTTSASLDVLGWANASIAFTPSLGLIPLDLTGVNEWNSTSTVSGSAEWNITDSWSDMGFGGVTGSGTHSTVGSWSTAGPVSLTGYKLQTTPVFPDHHARTGVVLIIQGPFDAYDGFVLVPHAFDQFGTAAQPYASRAFGSASIASGETLYVSSTGRGLGITAASQTFDADDTAVSALATPTTSGNSPAASAGPSATVMGEPMSVAQAQAEDNCLTDGCSAAAAAVSGLVVAAIVVLVAVAVAGTVGLIEWRSYVRRRPPTGLVGGYTESWSNGVPPAGAIQGSEKSLTLPSSGPSPPEEPNGPR